MTYTFFTQFTHKPKHTKRQSDICLQCKCNISYFKTIEQLRMPYSVGSGWPISGNKHVTHHHHDIKGPVSLLFLSAQSSMSSSKSSWHSRSCSIDIKVNYSSLSSHIVVLSLLIIANLAFLTGNVRYILSAMSTFGKTLVRCLSRTKESRFLDVGSVTAAREKLTNCASSSGKSSGRKIHVVFALHLLSVIQVLELEAQIGHKDWSASEVIPQQ